MSTRAALTTLINTNLNTGTSITAAEHRAVEQAIVDSCKPYNIGYFTLTNVGGTVGSTNQVSGVAGVLSATGTIPYTSVTKTTIVFNTATPMPSANYYVRIFIKALSTTPNNDTQVTVSFANTTTIGFDIYVKEISTLDESVQVYFEAIPLD